MNGYSSVKMWYVGGAKVFCVGCGGLDFDRILVFASEQFLNRVGAR
jgi:hypothetical protein